MTTRNYIIRVKRSQSWRLTDGEGEADSPSVREVSSLPGLGKGISVRSAKAHLSALLEEVAGGREIIITSDGRPKARLIPMEDCAGRVPFRGTREHLMTMPEWQGGPSAEEIIREDRDGRGW